MIDVFFICMNESDADDHFEILKSHAWNAKKVQGVNGIFNAHAKCAEMSTSDMFYVVDADAIILDDFNFRYTPNPSIEVYPKIPETKCVHIWRSVNPVNNLRYGYGAVKCFPKTAFENRSFNAVDVTTSLNSPVCIHEQLSNITYFNTSPFESWRSAFRECVKLSSAVINNEDDETQYRLETWCNHADPDSEYAEYVLSGARAGRLYGETNSKKYDKLLLINDFEWLKNQYELSESR